MSKKLSMETDIVHGIHHNYPTKDIVAPCHMSSIFKFDNVDHGSDLFSGNVDGYFYSRVGNPTVNQLEKKMAILENGEAAIGTSSGMSAIFMSIITLVKPGDNFIACSTIYGGTFALFSNELKNLDIDVKYVPPDKYNDIDFIESLIDDKTRFMSRKNGLLWHL